MAINVENILIKRGVEYKVSSGGFKARCFNPNHEDNNPSMSISHDGLYYCFSCGYKGNLIKEETGLHSSDTAIKKSKLLNYMDKLENKNLIIPPAATPFNSFFRGISSGVFRKFEAFTYQGKLYNVDVSGRVIFPIRSASGNIVAFQARLLSGSEVKYLNTPKGVSLPPFPISFVKEDTVYLVEGLFDALRLAELGLNNAVSIFGTNTFKRNKESDELTALRLKGVRNIGLMLDNDEAGEQATEALLNSKVLSSFNVFRVDYDAEDPGSLNSLPNVLQAS